MAHNEHDSTDTKPFTGAPNAPGAKDVILAPGSTNISVSPGLRDWLMAQRLSLAFTSYQTGQLFLVGAHPNGSISFNQQNFVRAMGLCWQPGRLYLGSLFQLWRLENMLRPGELANDAFDTALIPRNAQTTGAVDIHEVGVNSAGQVIFVNTKYSCLATLDLIHSFRPVWKPPFISRLAPEDRCHLNGLAMHDGAAKLVTAVSRSDIVGGWRERRHEGGVLIDVQTNDILTDQLSMPHSPRIVGDRIFVLDSGRGQIVEIDRESGAKTDIAFCPGFLRGLAIHRGYGIVTVSKPRHGSFSGLLLDDEMQRRDAEPWCGIMIVNLLTGDIVHWIRLEGHVTELFDVTAMPDITCPMAIGPESAEIQNSITMAA
ncbi:TIGR03032 family protein [Sphingobium sp.]|uniref:TIGR03032 family protein n=1 Tax=Sphingobium sp. TaxID=1912891 RepID=UPI003B3A6D14